MLKSSVIKRKLQSVPILLLVTLCSAFSVYCESVEHVSIHFASGNTPMTNTIRNNVQNPSTERRTWLTTSNRIFPRRMRPATKANFKQNYDSSSCDQVCLTLYSPVCGSDGKLYSNECMLQHASCENNGAITQVPCQHGLLGMNSPPYNPNSWGQPSYRPISFPPHQTTYPQRQKSPPLWGGSGGWDSGNVDFVCYGCNVFFTRRGQRGGVGR